jgi:ribosomal protein L1
MGAMCTINKIIVMTTEEAKEVLRNAGYYVDNLWCIEDVDAEITNDEKYDILDEVLTSEYIMKQINESIEVKVEEFLNY